MTQLQAGALPAHSCRMHAACWIKRQIERRLAPLLRRGGWTFKLAALGEDVRHIALSDSGMQHDADASFARRVARKFECCLASRQFPFAGLMQPASDIAAMVVLRSGLCVLSVLCA